MDRARVIQVCYICGKKYYVPIEFRTFYFDGHIVQYPYVENREMLCNHGAENEV